MHHERIIQNAYYVPDIDQGIAQFNALWGLGPFFVRRHIEVQNVTYRGAPAGLDISAAYTQSGDLMIELVTQHNDAPSTFRDRFAAHETGFHHVALDFSDHDERVAQFSAAGFEPVTSLVTSEGRGATFIDTTALLGHVTEIYRVNNSLKQLYADVRAAADGWDGKQLYREL